MSEASYTREALIVLCEAAIVPQHLWRNRDSQGAQAQIGKCWALLKAGCEFEFSTTEPCVSDNRIIWIEITSKGFNYFEEGNTTEDLFYIPTAARLDATKDDDWYC